MKVLRALLGGVLAFLALFAGHAHASPSDPAVKAAEKALEDYKLRVPWQDLGFTSEAEWSQATLGSQLPIYRLDITKVAKGLESASEALVDTKLVEFVVTAGRRPVTRVTVQLVGEAYEQYATGGSGADLSKGLEGLPAEPGTKLVLFGPAEFLYLDNGNEELMVYINPRPVSGIEPFRVYPAAKMLPLLQGFAINMMGSDDQAGGFGGPSSNPNGGSAGFQASWMWVAGIVLLLGGASGFRLHASRRGSAGGRGR